MNHLSQLKKVFNEKNKASHVFLFSSSESFFIKEALGTIRKGLKNDFDEEFFDFQFHVSEEAFLSAKTFPFLKSQKLLIFENIHLIKKPESLMEVIETLPLQNTLILCAQKLDRRKKAWKNLISKTFFLEFKKIYPNEKSKWLSWFFHKHGLKIDAQSSHWLSGFFSDDLENMNKEVEKIKIYLGKNIPKDYTVQPQHIKDVLFKTSSDNLFELGRLLASKKTKEFIVSVKTFFHQKENPVTLLIFLARHFRLLLKVKEGLQKGLRSKSLADFSGVHPFFLSEYTQQAQIWTTPQLERLMISFHHLDKELKSTGDLKEFSLETWPLVQKELDFLR